MVVSAVIVFFFIRNNNHPDQALNNKSVQQESIQKPATVEPQTLNSSQQQQTETPSKINSIMNIDESSDFPASATPPVPIKDRVTDLPPSSTNKKGNQPVMKQSNSENRQKQNTKQDNIEQPPSGDNGLYRTLSSDVKVNNTIYYDGKSYNFQVSSWRDKLKAETEVKRLRALGMNTFIVEAYLPQKGGKWYRVRVGSFNTEKEAQEYKNKNNLQ
jgi:cell division protein FtsN